MTDGSFSDAARAAIYEATGGRCAGCGSPQVTAQHRRARGKGGTSRAEIGQPGNGVALCGSGTTGCHGWAEHHPAAALLLGWRLDASDDLVGAPFWTRHGWYCWGVEDGWWYVAYVDPAELDHADERAAAVSEFTGALARRDPF